MHPTYTKPRDLSYLLTIEIRKRFWELQPNQDTCLDLNYIEIHNAAKILGRPVLKADDYAIEEMLDHSTNYCYFDNQVLKFGIGLQSYAMTPADIKQVLDIKQEWGEELYLTYNAAYMIKHGYSLTEEKGKHIIVTSKHGVRHYTDGKNCTCNPYGLPCAHAMLATHYLQHRQLWKSFV